MKKYQKIFAFLIVFMFFGTSWFYYDNYVKVSGIVKVSARENIKSNSFISMMYETKYQSGEYTETTESKWPSSRYTYNSTLSKCENGSNISWNDESKEVTISATTSDKCYVYFDKELLFSDICDSGDNLSNCIKDFYTTDGENGLYLHDADLANGANDGSYRYAGASESVNNYVCFASDAETCPEDNLYRIIGVFGDQVKLIKYDYATSAQLGTNGEYYGAYSYGSSTYKGTNYANIASYSWDTTNYENVWANSALNTVNLNTNYIAYLNGINTKWANMIAETTWKVGGNTRANIETSAMNVAYQNEIVNPAENTTYTDEIGLMYVSDYGYAASPSYWTYKGADTATTDYRAATGSNWMYMGLKEWTISRSSNGSSGVFNVSDAGHVYNNQVASCIAVRPSFSLKSTVGYSGVGDGSKESPYRLVEPPTFAEYIKNQYTTDGANSLYLHDADLTNGANDGSYRYAGASEDVNNYVCFASDAETCPEDNLYRIIGVFGDQVKLIKSDYATSIQLGTDGEYSTSTYSASSYSTYKGSLTAINRYYWDNTNRANVWANSALNTVNLNTNYIAYLNGINTKWANMIAETTWKVGGNTWANIGISAMNLAYQNEIVSPAENTTYADEIGLMYVSDYGYAASPTYWTYPGYSDSGAEYDYRAATGSNWMYMGLYEWTISRISAISNIVFIVYYTGLLYNDSVSYNDYGAVRPSFSLKSTVGYSGTGSGSASDPFRLS